MSQGGMFQRFKPHIILMALAQVCYAVLPFITIASFSHGMNPYVYVTYRHFVGALFILPFAYFADQKKRPNLTFALFGEIFVLSLFGVGLSQNLFFASSRYTSPTFQASIVNTITPLTFAFAVLFRLENLNMKSTNGVAKISGTLVSLSGVTLMALYKGTPVKKLNDGYIHIKRGTNYHEDLIRGSILLVCSSIGWSLRYIIQAGTLKRYPAQLSLTAWTNFIGGIQSCVFAVVNLPQPKAWKLGLNIDLWSILYAGIVVSGLAIFLQMWCTHERGPVFVTAFNPFGTVVVAAIGYFLVGEKQYIGTIIGSILVIIGLYILLWAQEGEANKRANVEARKVGVEVLWVQETEANKGGEGEDIKGGEKMLWAEDTEANKGGEAEAREKPVGEEIPTSLLQA